MSLLDRQRDAALGNKKHELTTVSRAQRRRLRELRALSVLAATTNDLSSLTTFDSDATPPVTSEEAAWLKSNDLLNGHYFDNNSLPVPTVPRHATRLSESRKTSKQPSPLPQDLDSADGNANEDAPNTSSDPMARKTRSATPGGGDPDTTVTRSKLRSAQLKADSPGASPAVVAPPTAEDVANLSSEAKALVDAETPVRTSRTVHLPPEDVQEKKFKERQDAEHEERRKSTSHLQAQNEAASSPSSTVGAYSAATPLPPQESPDTSPDSDTADMEVEPPKDLQPSPEEQRAKEEHVRVLEAQKEIAKKAALGDVATPDDQLKWEEREAAARDAEERASREAVNGPEPNAKNALDQTEAEDIMEDVQTNESTKDASVPIISMEDEGQESKGAQEDEDNITVTPRNRLSSVSSQSRLHPNDALQGLTPSSVSGRRTTRISSGAMTQRSVSDILGGTSDSRRDSSTPMSMRHPGDVQAFQTPRRMPRMLPQQSPTSGRDPIPLSELASLKGAAEDPDKDYLESLFRIQAHDSPNARTKPLTNLVKDAAKYLSTEDQFTYIHERLDYRILRRIYQLQNANKWSLRQMEKCAEPEEQVSHHDHMMAEMKWMRKDFKAERRMKKSVCAWLADRCADWVAASAEDRKAMQVKVKEPVEKKPAAESEDETPDLEMSGESAPEDDASPPTPKEEISLPTRLIVAPELSELVVGLERSGKLEDALKTLPVTSMQSFTSTLPHTEPMTAVSKFVEGKVFPSAVGPIRKRSRYDYEDDAAILSAEPNSKRLRFDRDIPAEDEAVALFHPDNKHIRDRLHANNAFRPPSEFVMPSTSFYEFRNGSQWVWEDDQKLRKLAKEYSFNWSLICDEMTLPSRHKSSAERRTPWECFERWVELETLPAEMRKTMYFKTWFQRLEQSQQASERRYQSQVAAIQQAAANNNNQTPLPLRRRTVPTRVEKRKNARYLWLVDAMRKLARKREQNSYKQAETQRAAAQRKAQSDGTTPQTRQAMLTPQEFSKRRHERDLQIAEAQRAHRQKIMEAQARQLQMARAAQQAGPNGVLGQQRPGVPNGQQPNGQMQPNGQQANANANGQMQQQARPGMPLAQRNGQHLNVPQANGQNMPQGQMQGPMSQQQQANMQRMMQQRNAQQFNGQQFPMQNGNMSSPGNGLTTQQQLQLNQQLLAQQQQQGNNTNSANGQDQNGQQHNGTNGQMSGSPSMPPPPTPQGNSQQLSSGHVPALIAIKNQLRAKYPQLSDDQLNTAATDQLTKQSQASNQVARQNAMNAAAGLQNQQGQQGQHGNNMPQQQQQQQQQYQHNQGAFQNNNQMPNGTGNFMNGDGSNNNSPQPSMANTNQSPQAQAYAAQMRRQMQMMRMQQQSSPNTGHASLNGSPNLAQASPNMAPASPNMQFTGNANGNMTPQMNGQQQGQQAQQGQAQGQGQNQQRPPSRSNTPQMQRLNSNGSAPGTAGNMPNGGMQSPNSMQQGSPRNMQASMAR